MFALSQITNFTQNRIDCENIRIELQIVKENLKKSLVKYVKYKILQEAVEDCVFNSNVLGKKLKLKTQEILLNQSCSQILSLGSENSINLMGLPEIFSNKQLTHDESFKLRKSLLAVLEDKYNILSSEFLKMSRENISDVPPTHEPLELSLSVEDSALFELKSELHEQRHKYLHKLWEEQQILDDLLKLRLDCLPTICDEKIKECQIKLRMNVLQTSMMQEKTRVDIFVENNNSFSAYEELMKDITEQQEECRSDVKYLKKLKEKYNHVSCKEFNDLLRSYVEYKTSLEKKKQMYEMLES